MHKAPDTNTDDDRLLTTPEAAELIGIKPGTLKLWRSQGRGPRYLKKPGGQRTPVRYRAQDVEKWRKQRAQASDPAAWPVVETE
jgi:predicted DNA-binding transcriptional regulator AlpA